MNGIFSYFRREYYTKYSIRVSYEIRQPTVQTIHTCMHAGTVGIPTHARNRVHFIYWYTAVQCMYGKSFFSVVVVVRNNMLKLTWYPLTHTNKSINLNQCDGCVCVRHAYEYYTIFILDVYVYIDFVQSHMILRNSNIYWNEADEQDVKSHHCIYWIRNHLAMWNSFNRQ